MGNEKYSLAHQSMLPDYAILDPRLTFGQSAYVTACTGIDALCQAIESYWSNGATEDSRQYASRAIPALRRGFEPTNLQVAEHKRGLAL